MLCGHSWREPCSRLVSSLVPSMSSRITYSLGIPNSRESRDTLSVTAFAMARSKRFSAQSSKTKLASTVYRQFDSGWTVM